MTTDRLGNCLVRGTDSNESTENRLDYVTTNVGQAEIDTVLVDG